MTIGERIRQLRKDNGLSQEEFAGKLGVSRQAVSKWERDEASPDMEKIQGLCINFGISADSLLLDGKKSGVAPDAKFLTERDRKHALRRMGRKAWNHLYLIGYVLIVLGIVNLLFAIVLGLFWNDLSREIGVLLTKYEIPFRLQVFYWLFAMMAILALLAILLGIVVAVRGKRSRKESMGAED